MFHDHKFQGADGIDAHRPVGFLLNLVDTPGHVDFSYEVSRSLAACQGALLVVDAAQGIQAQTVANFYLAFESNLTIIPVINKIDLPTADPERVKAQLKSMFDLDPNDALLTSAKTGQGLEHVLPAVIERMPPPTGNCNSPLRMLLLDSYYNEYKGVICHVAVVDDTLRKGDKISSAATGFKPVKHMVFSGVYPIEGSDFEVLNHAIERLTCNDASVSVTKESSTALSLGFRCGFLGLLHMDVFHQRLEQNWSCNNNKRNLNILRNFLIMKRHHKYVGPVITLCSERRGEQLEYTFIDRVSCYSCVKQNVESLRLLLFNIYQRSCMGTKYAAVRYQESDLVKLDILLNGQPVDALAAIVHKLKAQRVARDLVEKLKKFIDRQQFEVPIQAAIGSKVIARETIKAYRKDVVVRCEGGGDVNQKRKLLEKQKDGKKRMKHVGSVDIPQ
ncbi:hypothetical protein RHMOL_Rhmol10G0044600 [Rhododendron molle]|uniref:Uncharacterized protein n=1 Tax=Rhododendron molle TaxID=49168 RepID=A0ACC0LZ04_RHOML|nr:hypothetical protein RHMOL_Rhmol10G0044600 [Rhododendron molle]